MDAVEQTIIEEILKLGDKLADERRTQLNDLVGAWRENVRKAVREPYSEALQLDADSGNYFGKARDVSATGLFVETTGSFEIGDKVKMMLTFISAANPMRLSGHVVRKSEEGIGIEFDDQSQSQVQELDSIIAKHALILRSR